MYTNIGLYILNMQAWLQSVEKATVSETTDTARMRDIRINSQIVSICLSNLKAYMKVYRVITYIYIYIAT